jgi:hypothetical protein
MSYVQGLGEDITPSVGEVGDGRYPTKTSIFSQSIGRLLGKNDPNLSDLALLCLITFGSAGDLGNFAW